MAEIGKNTVQPIVKRKGQILKTVSSPSTSGSKKQVTNIVLDNGVLKASSDNGDTFEDITVKTAQNAQGAYIKPSGGIPKNDLASAVQTSLGKADTALQSVPIATSTKVGGVKPASKTTEMTQAVGVDSNGALWTKPATEIVFSTDAADGSAEVAGFSVESQNFKFKSSKVLYDYSSSDPNINWGRTGGILSGQTVTNSSLAQYSVYRVYIRLSSYTAVCLATSNNMNFYTTFTGVTEGNDGLYAAKFKISSKQITVESTGFFTIPSFTWNNRPGDGIYCIYKIEGVS